jgi:hypothetical protein
MSDAPSVTRNDHSPIRDRFLALPNPNNEMNPQGMTQPKASLSCGAPAGARLGKSADSLAAMTLTVLVTGAPLGVTLAGEKVQVAP